MPELPEVETVRGGLEPALVNKKIKSFQINRYDLRTPIPPDTVQMLGGQTVHALERRGKYIIMHIGMDKIAVLHLGMSGRVRIFAKRSDYAAEKHDHIVCEMNDGTTFIYNDPRRFGMFYLSTSDAWQSEKPFSTMGPEPLSAAWKAGDLYAALKLRKTPIKSALLDQRVVAGLGNIYVCEALYRAGIMPTRSANTITQPQSNALHAHIQDVLNEAIAAGGSTLRDYQHTDGSLGYFQHGFAVYDKEGSPCRAQGCKGIIERIVQSGRSTFFCPSCQS